MQRDGTLAPSDIPNGRIADELLEMVRSEDGLYYVSKFFVGFDRLNERVHRLSSAWFQKTVSTADALGAFRDPRSSGKTSGTTKSLPWWVWAQENKPGTPIHGVDTRIGVVAPKGSIASYAFIGDTARRWDSKAPGIRAYKELCPWVQANPRFWSVRNGLWLRRSDEGGEASLQPLGMESIATSAHFHILIIDDPIHEQNYRSETLVRQVIDWMYLSFNLVLPERGSRMFTGNFWRLGDVQDHLRPTNEKFKNVQVWERGMIACEECVTNRFPLDIPETSESPAVLHECVSEVFPIALMDAVEAKDGSRELVDPTMAVVDLARESTPSYQFATQNLNRPASADTLHLRREWLKFYSWHHDHDGTMAIRVPMEVNTALKAMAAGDERVTNPGAQPISGPKGNPGAGEIIPLYDMDVYILIDPASSESAGPRRARFSYVVVGRHKRRPMTVLLEEYADNQPQHVHLHAILDSYIRWRPYFKKMGYESVAYQATLRDAILSTARDVRHITTLKESDIEPIPRLRGEGPQEDRIKYALQPMMESGTLYVNREHRKFLGEVDTFGIAGVVRDLLDALSNGPRVWGAGKGKYNTGGTSAAVAAAKARAESVDVTGYGG